MCCRVKAATSYTVLAGLVPAISIMRVQCLPKRDARDELWYENDASVPVIVGRVHINPRCLLRL
jgi:hypothetical protein